MNQLNASKPCSSREHLESIDKPGHCVWCDAPMHRETSHVGVCAACKRPLPNDGRLFFCDKCNARAGIEATRGTPCSCVFNADGSVSNPCAAWNAVLEHRREIAARGIQRQIEKAATFKLEMHGAEGDAMACIFEAITQGATLILTGPNSVVSPSDSKYGATLEAASGDPDAHAMGNSLGDALVGLVRAWRRAAELEQHQVEHDNPRG